MARKKTLPDVGPEEAALGRRIGEIIKAKGIAPKAMAAALNLSVDSIYSMIAGKGVKQYVQLGEIARFLGMTPNDLLAFDPTKPGGESEGELVAAAFEAMLMDEGLAEEAVESMSRTALRAAAQKQMKNLDQRLAVMAAATALHREKSK